jgi:hypothetical protein
VGGPGLAFENWVFPPRRNPRVPHTPDFLWSFVGSLNFMRLSLMKGAHAVLSKAAYRKFGASRSFFARCGIPQVSPSSLCRAPQIHTGAHVRTWRTWAENDGRPRFPTSPHSPGPRMRFHLRKPHDVNERHSSRQEIRGKPHHSLPFRTTRRSLGPVCSASGEIRGSAALSWKCFDKAVKGSLKPRRIMERETGIEPATNGLGSRYSTIELLPPAATRLF